MTNQKIKQYRNDHPAAGRNNRKQRFPYRAQLPDQNFLLNLQSDHKKENRHQSIIHKGQHWHRFSMMHKRCEIAYLQINRMRQDIVVRLRPGRIGE